MAADGRIGPAPFCIDSLDKFTADYTADGEPSQFEADVTYSSVRPDGTDGLTEEELADIVTRDSMIGTGVPQAPTTA